MEYRGALQGAEARTDVLSSPIQLQAVLWIAI